MGKPKIRFQGYTEDWEQRKLEDMCSIITKQTGFDYSAKIKPSLVTSKETDTYSFIQNKDFEGMNINLDTDFYIPISVADKYPKITLDQPSLLISISGRIGNVGLYLLDSKAFIGGAVGICKLNDIEDGKTALYELLAPTGQKYFNSLIKASSHANITVEDIRQIEVLLPKNRDEKDKLNRFFENIDHLITLHQRKCDETKKLKKYMLQKMFPQNGHSVPEIRFSGFTEDWEQRKFGDDNDLITGYPFESEKFSEEGIKLVRGMNVKRGYLDFSNDICVRWNSTDGLENYLLEADDILIQMDGALIGKSYAKIAEEQLPALLVQRVTRARTRSKDACTDFMYQTIQRDFWRYIGMNKTETAVPHLSLNDIYNFKIMVPCLGEQQQIGAYFTNLDHLITLHQQKCEKLQKIKKFMLQNMFV